MFKKIQSFYLRKIILLIFNFAFYCCLDLKSFPILVLLIAFTYFCSCEKIKKKKAFTAIGVLGTIIIWLVYKLFINALPIGLSFYSFKIISYLIDSSKEKIDFKKTFLNYAIYVTYFPQILSGPISRSNNIVNQLHQTFRFQKEKWLKGIQLIFSGLFLKLVIANRAVVYVDTVFNNYRSYTGLALCIAAFLYSIQIYGDFSGYSNISIGFSNLLGIDIDRNFNRPYFSRSIKEFWGKWHISLSSWLKDYIYIPLGGNRKGKIRKWINSMITFLISGFWHGNGSGYLFWGFYHGILNNLKSPKINNKLQAIGFTILTFIEVTIGWIFFRLEDFFEGIHYIKHMLFNFTINYNSILSSVLPFTKDNSSIAMALILFLFIFIAFLIEVKNKNDYSKHNFCFKISFYIVSILLFGVFVSNKFIYMNY